jgi:XTP/dITP diphosphohydrolase
MILIAATGNAGKIKEIKEILSDFEILSLKDIYFEEEIEENGKSFFENALIKAKAVYDFSRQNYPEAIVLADDSGLEVEALGGKPGIFSARYAGKDAPQEALIQKVLQEMKAIPEAKRQARFKCCMALLSADGEAFYSQGYCEGRIGFERRGENGFGYDPIFLVKEFDYQKTMAELSSEEKNRISHRRKALDAIKERLAGGAMV